MQDRTQPRALRAGMSRTPVARIRPGSPWWLVGLVVAALAGCAAPPNRAPVEDRARARAPLAATPQATPDPAARAAQQPGAENAVKPGYYTVRAGDTMIRIGLENGQSWRDIARWNEIANPDQLEIGQVLRVVPPGVDPAAVAARGVPPVRIEARALGASAPAAAAASAGSAVPTAPPASAPATPAPAARDADDDVAWAWPASGPVVTSFDDARNKGLAISGRPGDPVLAAADGRVVYAGSGLRGYGNLIILKHNATYLTAYAHNQRLLVREDQSVKRGQRIAEMGSSDAERVQLHFEIRKQGKPVDPSRLLPPR